MKTILLLFLLVSVGGACSAQKNIVNDSVVKIINGQEIFNALYASADRNNDSLEKWVGSGFLLFKMKLDGDHFTNIQCSQKKHPLLLINLVTEVLKAQQVKTSDTIANGYNFVLHLTYDFNKPNVSLEESLRKIPEIDWNDLLREKPSSFNQLFGIEDTSRAVYGAKCFFLPPITLARKREKPEPY